MTKPLKPKSSDPIDDLIDQQLASLWMENTALGGRATTWQSNGSGDRSMSNYVEDMFINALDKKYHYLSQQAERMYGYLEEGYSQEEMGNLLGTSERNVRRIKKQLEEELSDGTKSQV